MLDPRDRASLDRVAHELRLVRLALIAGAQLARGSLMPSITRFDIVASSFRARRAKLAERMNALHERHDASMARGDDMAEQFDAAIKQVDAEIDAMEGELRQLSNFPPQDDASSGGVK